MASSLDWVLLLRKHGGLSMAGLHTDMRQLCYDPDHLCAQEVRLATRFHMIQFLPIGIEGIRGREG